MQNRFVPIVKRNKLAYKVVRYLHAKYKEFKNIKHSYSTFKELNALGFLEVLEARMPFPV